MIGNCGPKIASLAAAALGLDLLFAKGFERAGLVARVAVDLRQEAPFGR